MLNDSSVENPEKLFNALREQSFSLEALIEATCDRLALTDEEFGEKLSESLYSKLPPEPKRQQIIRCLSAKNPGDLPKKVWQDFMDYVASLDKVPSALALAEVVETAYRRGIGPSAILTLNAEPLLYALINARAAILCEKPAANDQTGVPCAALLDAVTRSTSSRSSDRIPYHFCHGLLRVNGAKGGLLEGGSPEKLVFSETEYLELANSSFSWQAATFTNLALTKSMIFVGLSFVDTNLRKWLSWIYANRTQEIRALATYRSQRLEQSSKDAPSLPKASTFHYWLNVRPSEPGQKEWIESVVAHLGVRIVWLDKWEQVGDAFASLVGV